MKRNRKLKEEDLMSNKRSFILLATLVLLAIATFTVTIPLTRAATSASPAAVIGWNAIAQRAAIQVAKQPRRSP